MSSERPSVLVVDDSRLVRRVLVELLQASGEFSVAGEAEDGLDAIRKIHLLNPDLVTLDVPPDTETLAQIAEITSATAFDAPTANDLSAVYDNLQSRIGYTQEEQEVTSWFAAGALALVVVAAGLSALWFGRLP